MTILSQATTDTQTERSFAELRRRFPSWEQLRDAPASAIARAIHGSGLSRQKAPRIKAALRHITRACGRIALSFLQQMPVAEARQWLRQIAGVGPKTASIVLLFAFNKPVFPVDTHIHRVTRRLGWIPPRANAEQAHVLGARFARRAGRAAKSARSKTCAIIFRQSMTRFNTTNHQDTKTPSALKWFLRAFVSLWLICFIANCTPNQSAAVGHWEKRRSMQEERSWIGMASVSGKIYAIGGMTGPQGQRLNSVERYDPKTNEWQYVAPMPTARSSPGAVAVRDQIYVMGGFPATGTTTVVEAFDPQKNAWRTGLAPMPTKRFDLASAAIGDIIYTMGGYDVREMNVVEAYDTLNDRWSTLPPMPTARYALQAVVVDGKIWAMGGRNEQGPTDIIEMFDPKTQQWSRSNLRLPEPLAGFGATIGGQLHVAKYDKYYALDLKTGAWSQRPPMLTSRHGLQLTYIDGLLYAVGGCTPGEGNLFDVAKNEVYKE